MKKIIVIIAITIIFGGFLFYHYIYAGDFSQKQDNSKQEKDTITQNLNEVELQNIQNTEEKILNTIYFDNHGNASYEEPVTHIKTPESVRAVYMTSWVAGRRDLRTKIHTQIKENESINAVVIDIKDDTGKISFLIDHPLIHELHAAENRIPDIREFIEELHKDNIYVIGRIAVFQDPHLIKQWPEEAVKKQSDPEQLWVDRKKIGWMNVSSEKVWDYVNTIAEESYQIGFDEINFDYIRFPSDGNMKDIIYKIPEGKTRQDVLEDFFRYTHDRLKSQNIVISADIFGMTTVNTDDLGIGQILEKTLPYFDYVCPMVYPSHFPNNWAGLSEPAKNPYEVIKISIEKAIERTEAIGESKEKIRPWLQDFDLGAIYTQELVAAQIRAVYDVGLDSWFMWDPKNTYTISAFISP